AKTTKPTSMTPLPERGLQERPASTIDATSEIHFTIVVITLTSISCYRRELPRAQLAGFAVLAAPGSACAVGLSADVLDEILTCRRCVRTFVLRERCGAGCCRA